jgi:hypothetical protein
MARSFYRPAVTITVVDSKKTVTYYHQASARATLPCLSATDAFINAGIKFGFDGDSFRAHHSK